MATFPAGKILKNGFKRQRTIKVVRSDMESGPAKQALRSTTGYLRFPVKYFFTKAEYEIFDNWVKNTINFVGVFDWTEPLTGNIMEARIVNGDISDAEPFNPHLAHWVVSFVLEISD